MVGSRFAGALAIDGRRRAPTRPARRAAAVARAILIDCRSVVVAGSPQRSPAALRSDRPDPLPAPSAARRAATPPVAAAPRAPRELAAAADARRRAVHAHRRLHDHDAAGAAVHAALRDRPAAVRLPGVGVHVRGGGERLRRRVLDRPLRPQARAARALRRIHRRDGAVRDRARLSAAARGAHRRRHVRRRASAASCSRSSPTSCRMRAARDGDGASSRRRSRWRRSPACRSSLWIAAHFSWRAPFLALAAFSVAVGAGGVRAAAAARRARRARRRAAVRSRSCARSSACPTTCARSPS